MTLRSLALTLTLTAVTIAPALAQTARTPAPPRTPPAAEAPEAPKMALPPQAPPAPRKPLQPINVRIDVTITDQGRAGAPTMKKTVSIVTSDGFGGRIRSTANYSALPPVPLNVDADVEILTDGKVRTRVNLQYDLPAGVDGQTQNIPNVGALKTTQIQENLSLILESGKPILAAQSADPVGDRQVTIEVKATVLR